jgi:hypothetical protein
MKRSVRPLGQPTRGKTAINRLRQVDVYAALALEGLFVGGRPLIVDVGYGAYPWTALEMARRLRRINPGLRLLGVEIDPERVATAQPHAAPPDISFRLGGFNLRAVMGGEQARYIRAYNVLRQYEESAVEEALAAMAESLEEGGILIEGTCNPSGRLVAFDVYRKRAGLTHEALVFGTNFRAPVEAEDFKAILPKRLIRHALDPIPDAFFATWQREFVQWRSTSLDNRQMWQRAALGLRRSYPIEGRSGLLRRGYLVLRTPLR